jgi:hypothetical protein
MICKITYYILNLLIMYTIHFLHVYAKSHFYAFYI